MKDKPKTGATPEYRLVVPDGVRKIRADKILRDHFPEFSRSRLQRFFSEDLVCSNHKVISKNDRLTTGDTVTFSVLPVRSLDLRAVDIPLDVLYEDEHFIAINKTPGMVVHPGSGTSEDTLVHALLHHCGDSLMGIGGVERPGIVHRLDKGTSGVMVAAKTQKGFEGLSHSFSEREIDKTYLAIVKGVPELLSGLVDKPIGRHRTNRVKMSVLETGRHALSEWEKISKFGSVAALLQVYIHTGRTHQIRVHLSNLGFPVFGDRLYGYRQPEEMKSFEEPERVMLHSRQLSFKHPLSGDPLTLEAPVPSDMEQLMGLLEKEFGRK